MRVFLVALMVALVAALSAAGTASAHRPEITGSADYAYVKVYQAWNENWCGYGTGWACNKRRSSHKVAAFGDHSWIVGSCWIDTKGTRFIYTAWKQWCVYQRVGHGILAELVRPSDPNIHNGRVLNASG